MQGPHQGAQKSTSTGIAVDASGDAHIAGSTESSDTSFPVAVGPDLKVPTLTAYWKIANWLERECWDQYGVIFEGHPNLKRILNVDEMDYFPLRKEFPLEDQSRTDKDDDMFGR